MIIRNESISDYHSNPAVSSTRLMDLSPCEQFYYMRHVAKTLPREGAKCFDVGNGAHGLILEGRKAMEERTVLQPECYENDKRERKPWTYAANVCKAWREMHRGKVILTADDFATIDKMAAAVGENPDAAALLSGGESEVTFRVQHPAFAVQCRADHWLPDGVPERGMAGATCVDLKTCDTIERFRSEYFKLRYYYRAAFYLDVIDQVTGDRPAFVFVAVEKSAPWRCEVFEPSEADLELGRNEMLADLKTLKGCFESGVWPGSKLGVQLIELTSWQRKIAAENGAGIYEEAGA